MKTKAPMRRVMRTKEEAKDAYNKMASWYDWLAGSSEKKYKDEGLKQLEARAGETILEIGSGTGNCLIALARSVGQTGKVYGLDLAPGMLKVAESRVREAGLVEDVAFSCADGAHLPFADSFCDALFMSFTLELFDTPEIPLVLLECYRVLRRNGRLCIVAMAKKESSGTMVTLYEWIHDRFTKYVDCRPIYVQNAVEDAGFKIVNVTEMSMVGLPVAIVLAQIG